MPGGTHFGDLLTRAIDKAGTPACVGLDPVLERLPGAVRAAQGRDVEQIRAFCLGVLDAVAGIVPAVKPQSACFERFGSPGVGVLEEVIDRARSLGFVVVLDVKRGDIGTTAAHYAASAASMGAHAVTVNGYMGPSAVTPFIEAGLGVYVLVRTSNADAGYLQSGRLDSGKTVAERMAEMVAELGRGLVGASGLSSVGAVVGVSRGAPGAPGPPGGRAGCDGWRGLMPEAPVLVPGVGAQGGTVGDVRPLVRPGHTGGGVGVLINASRSVLYADGRGGWQDRIRSAASVFASDAADGLHIVGDERH